MSKPKHYMRGRRFYVGYGFMSAELNARRGSLSYSRYLAEEIMSNKHKPEHHRKLRAYLERAR